MGELRQPCCRDLRTSQELPTGALVTTFTWRNLGIVRRIEEGIQECSVSAQLDDTWEFECAVGIVS